MLNVPHVNNCHTILPYCKIPFLLKFATGKSDAEKKEIIKKVETQLVTFNGKDKLTVDEYYSVLKVQVGFFKLRRVCGHLVLSVSSSR